MSIGEVVDYVSFLDRKITFLPSLRSIVPKDIVFEGILTKQGTTSGK